jgi:HEAT repeat protein
VLVFLDDPDPGRRAAAARMLAWSDSIDADSLRALVARAGDEELVVDAVLATLRRHARRHPAAVLPGLIAIARQGGEQQKHALDALSTIGADAAPAIPMLCEALRSTDSPIRARAARALGKIGALATVAIPDLERVCRDPVRPVAAHAAQALVNIRGR